MLFPEAFPSVNRACELTEGKYLGLSAQNFIIIHPNFMMIRFFLQVKKKVLREAQASKYNLIKFFRIICVYKLKMLFIVHVYYFKI